MQFLKILTLFFCCFSCSAIAQQTPYKYSITKKITVRHAAVVSAHALATDAGIQILKQGGNAFDAAIATQLALAVVYPGAGNLGGGGFLVGHTHIGKSIAIDYRETAPSRSSKNMFLDSAGNAITKLSLEGRLASGVPGTVAGLFATIKYARLPFHKLISTAIKLAEKGFRLTATQAKDLNDSVKVFKEMNKNKIAFVKDEPWKAGDILVQTDLANTLKRIRDKGLSGFYEGRTAELIIAEMKSSNGIITAADLKNYTATEREPMKFSYRGSEVITMPLPSSGGIILQQILKMTEQKDLRSYPFHSGESVQLIVEAERRAYADRAEYLGDPDFVNVPVKTLVSDAYLAERIKDYVPGKAGKSTFLNSSETKESEQTTHISIIDKEGNAVSVTTTLNDHFGSKTVISGAGFLMNNEMDDFSVKAGVANMYGAIGNDKNAIAPGKRMLSSMTPTIVLKNNKPYMVVGSPGGTTIPTSVFQTLVNIIDYNMTPADAVNKPKFHHQWLPDKIFIEKDFSTATKDRLTGMGYTVTERTNIGRTELIMIDTSKGKQRITAIADKRGEDDASGY